MTLSRLSLVISFILSTASISGQKLYPPTLSLHREDILRHPESRSFASITNDFETLFFNQKLDHFNYRPKSYTIFQQRYLIDSKYWGGTNSSALIFVYLRNEHRYFGESIPLGMSFEEALEDANIHGYFSSAQALADYAAIIMHAKQNLKARSSPVIVVGGSYGGSKCIGQYLYLGT
ncbi:hypothetical protein NL676_004806 [Syzygium grande]|nr:hypothetical protein NL676_004806 [Syzygium grande]